MRIAQLGARRAATHWIAIAVVCGIAAAQQGSPSFEVASIKESSASGAIAGGIPNDPLRFSQPRITLKLLMSLAYDVPDAQIAGGPDWVSTQQYDLEAKSETAAARDQQMLMLRSLLADRFRLVFHRETRPVSVYVLTVGKNGPRIGPSFHPSAAGDPRPLSSPGKPALRTSMKQFAAFVTMYLKVPFPSAGTPPVPAEPLPAIDQTGLTGDYDIVIDLKAASGSWFDALESLGLKLERGNLPLEVLVIDSASRPTAN